MKIALAKHLYRVDVVPCAKATNQIGLPNPQPQVVFSGSLQLCIKKKRKENKTGCQRLRQETGYCPFEVEQCISVLYFELCENTSGTRVCNLLFGQYGLYLD